MALAQFSKQVLTASLGNGSDVACHPAGCVCSPQCVEKMSGNARHLIYASHLRLVPCECHVCRHHRYETCDTCIEASQTGHENCACDACQRREVFVEPLRPEQVTMRMRADILHRSAQYHVINANSGTVPDIVKKEPVVEETGDQGAVESRVTRFEQVLQELHAKRNRDMEDERQADSIEDLWGEPPVLPARVSATDNIVFHVIGDYVLSKRNKRAKALSVKINTKRVRVPEDFWITRTVIYSGHVTGHIELKVCRDSEDDNAMVFVMRFVTPGEGAIYNSNCTTLHDLKRCFRSMTRALLEHKPRLISARDAKESVINACGIQEIWNLFQSDEEMHQNPQVVARGLKRMRKSDDDDDDDE